MYSPLSYHMLVLSCTDSVIEHHHWMNSWADSEVFQVQHMYHCSAVGVLPAPLLLLR